MGDQLNRLQELKNFFESIFDEEELKQMIELFPISEAGLQFAKSLYQLIQLIEKIINCCNMYPLLIEVFTQYIDNEKNQVQASDEVGVFSIQEYNDLLRESIINEEEHAGRFILSWFVMSLTSITDKYINKIVRELELSDINTYQKKSIKERMREILEKSNLWEQFKVEKEEIPEIETLFTDLIKKRHKAAHHELTLDWATKLIDRNFLQAVNGIIKIQSKIAELAYGLSRSEVEEESLKLSAIIRVMGTIFLYYVGFYDRFVSLSQKSNPKGF